MVGRAFAGLILLVLAGCGKGPSVAPVAPNADGASPVYDAAFWKTWGDGYAELTSYDLVYPRYGAARGPVAR